MVKHYLHFDWLPSPYKGEGLGGEVVDKPYKFTPSLKILKCVMV